jgi:hypothetical protein
MFSASQVARHLEILLYVLQMRLHLERLVPSQIVMYFSHTTNESVMIIAGQDFGINFSAIFNANNSPCPLSMLDFPT